MARRRIRTWVASIGGAATVALLTVSCTSGSTSSPHHDFDAAGDQNASAAADHDSAADHGSDADHDSDAGGDDIQGALSSHLEGLKESIPGNGGESEEGPASAARFEFLKRAYPAKTISVAKTEGALHAYARAVSRTTTSNAVAQHRWTGLGPSRAVYPHTPLRNAGNYVPNRYIASGRVTALAIAKTCRPGNCRLWLAAAGGGVWRTNDALAKPPAWKYLGGPLGINAVGSITVDPSDPTGKTVWVGTGEGNLSGDSAGGVGLFKSTNGGNTWTGPYGKRPLRGKGVADLAIDPDNGDVIYEATTTAVRGITSVGGGETSPVPGATRWGLYKSVDGGRHWRFIHDGSRHRSACTGSLQEYENLGPCSPAGVRFVRLDPTNPRIVYASSYSRGIWRSTDAGRTWVQIKTSLDRSAAVTIAAIDVTALPNGKTRMYAYEGNYDIEYSRLFRSDNVASGHPSFTDLTSTDPADPGYGTYDLCGGQCWYDEFVHTPTGHPDMVYVGGSYAYGEVGNLSNGRGVVLSTDAGVTATDMTMDGTDPVHPNGLHPDQHALVTDPNHPFRFFEGNDGGLMRSSGAFANVSAWCGNRGLAGDELSRCRQLLSRVPSRLYGENAGLSTLQFSSLSISPFDSTVLQGGTQDNGTWTTTQHRGTWLNSHVGDGGQSGFDARRRSVRFHTFYDASIEVNFDNGRLSKWIWTSDPIYGQPGNEFYVPAISDPVVSGTMFVGTGSSVYRTTTFGLGKRTIKQAQRICNSWTGTYAHKCGDWKPTGQVALTSPSYGDRAGGSVAAIERTSADRSTAWAATSHGRVFITHNVDAANPAAVTWKRLDDDARNDPNRFVSSITIDPKNPNRAWISYSGYDASTPKTPGHIFRVSYNNRRATWTDASANLDDLPVNDLVRDDRTGDLYASTDFGVLRAAAGTGSWTVAAPGMPNVEVPGLTISSKDRVLYAATHGLGAFRLALG